MKTGFVSLVGAGPGDYELISLKGQRLIKNADVIVYDRLADNRLLSWARKDVELIYVGKKSRKHTMVQDDINRLLVAKAQAGKTVVRLKGGDPFVFGRGGEEAALLAAEGIRFEIVPGITSAISVPAYAGIPVTSRGVAVSFAVVTGHEEADKQRSQVNWPHLATAVDTLVFLMGIENLAQITANLLKNGRAPETPAAVIRWGTKPEQRTLVTTLEQAVEDVQKSGLKPPAIFIVGEVVKLREKLAWFEKRPLFGKKILVTRSREQASILVEKLESLGASCLEAPVIIIQPLENAAEFSRVLDNLPSYQWLIFTSANGVKYFFERLYEHKIDSRKLAQAKIVAVGQATQACLLEHGLLADFVPQEFTGEGIIRALEGQVKAGERVLMPRAKKAREILPEWLRQIGAEVEVMPVYQTVLATGCADDLKAQLEQGTIDLITFTSSSTVKNLLSLLGEGALALLKKNKVACIGPVTGATCREYGLEPVFSCQTHTIDNFTEQIKAYFEECKQNV